jgi:hypothetical protein
MGGEHWQRIVLLVDAAVKTGNKPLAERVFEVALATKRGTHLDFFQRKYEQLRSGYWDPDPRK